MGSRIFQDRTNDGKGNGSKCVAISKIVTTRPATRLSFKLAKEDICSKSTSLNMNDSIREPEAKRIKRVSSSTPNENIVPVENNIVSKLEDQNELYKLKLSNIDYHRTEKIDNTTHKTERRSLRSNKQVIEKPVISTESEEETIITEPVEVLLNHDFWKSNAGNNEEHWNEVINRTKTSLMQMEFPSMTENYQRIGHCEEGASSTSTYDSTNIIILAERTFMKNRKKQTEYWVKREGKLLNDQEWYPEDRIGVDLINEYKKREKVIEMFEKTMRKKKGDTGFPKMYPHSKKRKEFLGGESAKWRLRLREIEEHWNSQLKSTGQAPVYIEDWTGYENTARFKIGSRPASFLKTNRRVLNFEYLVQNMVPQDLANELFDYEQRHVQDSKYSCNCEGICGNCACERFSLVKIRKGHVQFLDENNPIYTPCGILCNCSPNCVKRTLTAVGRQYPLVLFYTGKRGWGVFSGARLRVGSFLGIYTGELKRPSNLGNTSYQFRIPTILKDNPTDPDEQEKELCLESACSANELSLVNHSCENGNIRSFHIANKNRFNLHDIGFVVTQPVEPGDELLYNYFKGSGKGDKDICWYRLSSSEFSQLASRLLGGILGKSRESGQNEENNKTKRKADKSKNQPQETQKEEKEMRCKLYGGRVKIVPERPYSVNKIFDCEDPGQAALRVLKEFVFSTCEKGPDNLVKEYAKLEQYPDSTATCNEFKANMNKNRYCDVLCMDSTRVKLDLLDRDAGDYIHANYIKNPILDSKFICTQGPLSTTIYDFWRMIFQEKVQSIVMLCRPCEDGRPKCVIYWPENVTESLTFASLTVTNQGEVKETDEFNTISLCIEINKDYDVSSIPEAARKPMYVKLLRWTTWPDRGVPDESSCMIPLRLLDRVRSNPTVIHCSAGIGRTGSMMVLEVALKKIAQGASIDVREITRELRKSRCQCVQTEVQYLYIHRVLVENALKHVNLEEEAKMAAKSFLAKYDERMLK